MTLIGLLPLNLTVGLYVQCMCRQTNRNAFSEEQILTKFHCICMRLTHGFFSNKFDQKMKINCLTHVLMHVKQVKMNIDNNEKV